MTDIRHTENNRVKAIRFSQRPLSGQTVTGYGGNIPTEIEIQYLGTDDRTRWHRVRMMQYGNAGSAFVRIGGEDVFLDTDTEHDIMAARENR